VIGENSFRRDHVRQLQGVCTGACTPTFAPLAAAFAFDDALDVVATGGGA
jgi:hypothetical protein